MSPCDPKVQSYISNGSCGLNESLKLSSIATLLNDLEVTGFAVIGMDGINYTGSADSDLAAMNKEQREEFYLANAERWATWAKNNNFEYFELGNENDLPGEMVDQGVGIGWDPEDYGVFAQKMALGTIGIVLGTIVSMLPLIILSPIQVRKILKLKDKGIWSK